MQALLSHNAKVYVASRSEEKARAAIKDLKEQTGKEALFLKLDLGDLRSVRAAAEQFKRYVDQSVMIIKDNSLSLTFVL